MRTKRRALVLTDETARHPFRQSLPPHVCAVPVEPASEPRRSRLAASDWKDFFVAYSVMFVTISVFIA